MVNELIWFSVKWWLSSYRNFIDQEHRAHSEKYWDSRVLHLFLLFYVGFDKNRKYVASCVVFWYWFYQHAKIFMMNQDGQMSLCFMLISIVTDKSAASKNGIGSSLVPLAPGINDNWGVVRRAYNESIWVGYKAKCQKKIL
jgi:phytoene desaturase